MNNKVLAQITVFNDFKKIAKHLEYMDNFELCDFLLVDDGSENDFFDKIQSNKKIKCIRHESNLGYGSSFITGYIFARDNGYQTLISLDSDSYDFFADIKEIINQAKYGYEIVNLSRILENYDHEKISADFTELISYLSNEITSATSYDITDPLSLSKGFNVESLKEIEFVESGLSVFLQIFIQGDYYGLQCIEIPIVGKTDYFKELIETEDFEYYRNMLATEIFLYKKDIP